METYDRQTAHANERFTPGRGLRECRATVAHPFSMWVRRNSSEPGKRLQQGDVAPARIPFRLDSGAHPDLIGVDAHGHTVFHLRGCPAVSAYESRGTSRVRFFGEFRLPERTTALGFRSTVARKRLSRFAAAGYFVKPFTAA